MAGDHPSPATSAGDVADVAAAFEAMPAVLWAFAGPEHRVVAANAAARASIGYRPDIIGRPIRDVIPEMAGQQIFEMIDEVYRTGQPVSHADRRVLVDRDADGHLEEGYFTYTFLPTRHADGGVSGMVVHIVETTPWVRQRQAEHARAEDSERRYLAARDIVLTLQRSLLPPGLPALARVRLSARYVIAGTEAAAGGDWFDAIPMSGGRVALVVGDVVGHGPQAAAAMGQLRAVALQALASGASIAETSARMDGLAARVPAALAATACLALLDPSTGSLQYSSRGHPPPLIVDVRGQARILDGGRSGPLGSATGPAPVEHVRLTGGQLLLLYSDGLIERPDKAFDDSLTELGEVASAVLRERVRSDASVPMLPADRLCALVLERFAWSGFRDDVTVLVAELTQPAPPLSITMPATPEHLATIRRNVHDWLASYGVGPDDIHALQHAVGEASINAIEHAYRDHPIGTVTVSGHIDDAGVARLRIKDGGNWKPATTDPGIRGRGLMLMRALTDRVVVDAGQDGTAITIESRVHRPVLVGTTRDVTGGVEPVVDGRLDVEFAAEVERGDHPVIHLRGPIDPSTVDQARRAIMDARRSAGREPIVDLSEVTYLTSVGVRLLYELNRAAAERVPIVAPARSRAHQILALTGLPHMPA